jgi:hypothetical protein
MTGFPSRPFRQKHPRHHCGASVPFEVLQLWFATSTPVPDLALDPSQSLCAIKLLFLNCGQSAKETEMRREFLRVRAFQSILRDWSDLEL